MTWLLPTYGTYAQNFFPGRHSVSHFNMATYGLSTRDGHRLIDLDGSGKIDLRGETDGFGQVSTRVDGHDRAGGRSDLAARNCRKLAVSENGDRLEKQRMSLESEE